MFKPILFAAVPASIYMNVMVVKNHFEHLEHPVYQKPPQERVDYVTGEMVSLIKNKVDTPKEELIEKVCPKIHGARVCKRILKSDSHYNKFIESLKKNETPKFNVSELYSGQEKHSNHH